MIRELLKCRLSLSLNPATIESAAYKSTTATHRPSQLVCLKSTVSKMHIVPLALLVCKSNVIVPLS